MADEGELRQRKPAPEAKWTKIDPSTTKIRTKKEIEDEEDVYYPWWDLLRLTVGLAIAYCGLSYLASGGETYSIGYEVPMKYLHLDSIPNPFVSQSPAGSFHMLALAYSDSFALKAFLANQVHGFLTCRESQYGSHPRNWQLSTAPTRTSRSTLPSTAPSTTSQRTAAPTGPAARTNSLPASTPRAPT